MQKIRAAIFNTRAPIFHGGVESRIIEVAKRLQNEVQTTVYSATKTGFRKPVKLDGLSIIPCFSTESIYPFDNWIFNNTISRNARKIEADIFEAHTDSGYGLLKFLKKNEEKKPFIHTIHGVLSDEYYHSYLKEKLSLRSKLANLLMFQLAKREKETAKKATIVVTISKYTKRRICEDYNISPSKIKIVPNGVDIYRFRPIKENKKTREKFKLYQKTSVLFVGKLIPRKGLFYLIEASKQVIEEFRETQFIIVGEGPLKNKLQNNIKKANLQNNFVFTGEVNDFELPKLYSSADVFAFPSIQEGQGIALLEAQATAKPVVAFNSSGITEAVDDKKTGFLIKPYNSEHFASAIIKLLSDKQIRLKMGEQGRKFVSKNFSWKNCSEKMYRVYQETLKAT